ncbi:hypothetical protein [Pseudothauera rhizosphaerae]|uniref:Uncharacterized protein n=1 Tax=Pseudothauera rhizosphaerae TaxID=2565932 RepID=A0A4S4ANX4_9RHOO|nr:hypothetical protein [Pseudothauera rhizosphaerae]THF60934.1 hypothetical protein E6O51_11945 [Pseudothauera rhizosphaerae]
MTPPVTLDQIRAAVDRLAVAHTATTARAALCHDEIKAAIQPIYDRHRAGMDAAAEEEAAAHRALMSLLEGAPQLFEKPRSVSVNGVRAGYRKAEDSLDWGDDAALIKRIRALLPAQADLLIRTEETLVADALAQLPAAAHQKLGINRISGADNPFITIGAADVEKLAQALIADAIRRQGDDDKPKERKGKAKAKSKEVA